MKRRLDEDAPSRFEDGKLYSEARAAALLGVSAKRLRAARKRGELGYKYLAGGFHYLGRWLRAWLERPDFAEGVDGGRCDVPAVRPAGGDGTAGPIRGLRIARGE